MLKPLARHTILAVVLLVLAALTACGTPTPAPARFTQTVDGLTISLEATASPKLNTNEYFTVTLTDAQGKPVDGADVYLDLTMLTMPMGTNRPVAEAQGQGRYLAASAYTMLGEWQITVFAKVAGVAHQAIFKLTVAE
ncbi:MAG: FixH family protein [Chloroflexales bacterium]